MNLYNLEHSRHHKVIDQSTHVSSIIGKQQFTWPIHCSNVVLCSYYLWTRPWIAFVHHALPLFPCRTTAPYSTGGGGALNEAGFQIMSKQWTAQWRVKKPDNSATGGTPDEQAPAVRTPDAPNIEVILATILAKNYEKFLATMLAKNYEKFEALRREQSAPTTAGSSSQPDEQPDEVRLAQHLSRHRASKRGRCSPSLDRVVNLSDSECTDSDSPAVEIEMRTHGKTSTSGITASDMGWA